jgi:hypothetical protein
MCSNVVVSPREAVDPVIESPYFGVQIPIKRRGRIYDSIYSNALVIDTSGVEIGWVQELKISSRDLNVHQARLSTTKR